MDNTIRDRNHVKNLFENIEECFERGLITEQERDEAMDAVIAGHNADVDRRKSRLV